MKITQKILLSQPFAQARSCSAFEQFQCVQGQYRAAASQAKVATIPDSDSSLATGPPYLANTLATSLATGPSYLATTLATSQAPGPPYMARPGPGVGHRAPLATSSPSGIPTYQPDR